MGFTASEDLKTLLDAHTFADNANLDDEPFIKLIDSGETLVDSVTHRPIYPEHGTIIIGEENLNNVEDWVNHSNEFYRILVDVIFTDQTNSTKLKSLMTEIRNAFKTENNTVDRDYYWKMLYQWSGLTQEGAVRVFVDMKKEWVL